MEYLALIYNNTQMVTRPEQWEAFFERAKGSRVFKGGSALGSSLMFGDDSIESTEDKIVGFMRFDADNSDEVMELLKLHPVLLNGGTMELREMPRTD